MGGSRVTPLGGPVGTPMESPVLYGLHPNAEINFRTVQVRPRNPAEQPQPVASANASSG